MDNKKITILFLSTFPFITCMERELTQFNLFLDDNLTKLVESIPYSPREIAMLIKTCAYSPQISLDPYNIKILFKLTPERINTLFLAHIKDKNMRSFMLSLGANIKARTPKGKNCLWKITDSQLLKELIEKGADVNALNKKGHTPLGSLSTLYKKNDKNAFEKFPAAQTLLAYKADPNLGNSNYLLYEILLFSNNIYKGLETVQLFLKKGMNVNIQNTPEYNPLIAAIYGNNYSAVDFLLKNNADPNRPDALSNYPLHIALGKSSTMPYPINPLIVMNLLRYNADVNVLYPDCEMTPLDVARKYCDITIINALMEKKAQTYAEIVKNIASQSKETF